MKKILVMGGTRFFGKRLVERLVAEGHEVTVATRGNTADGFGDSVQRLVIDRQDKAGLQPIGQQAWDVVYDQICFSSQDAAEALEILGDRVGRYIFTSSLSVYDQLAGTILVEGQVDAARHAIEMGRMEAFGYAEGKRQAEAVFAQKARFPVTSVRIPIVFGDDDYTRRLHDPIAQIKRGDPFAVGDEPVEICLISSAEAAEVLFWLGMDLAEPVAGAVNACSQGNITPQEIVAMIGEATAVSPNLIPPDPDGAGSIFTLPKDWAMSTQKAEALGYVFEPVRDWLRPLIGRIAAES